MRFLLKGVITLVGGGLILLSLLFILAVTQADPVLQRIAQYGLTHLFQAPVTVDEARLIPLAFTLELKGISVANPPEFKDDSPALSVDRVAVTLDPATVFSDTPSVREVRVEGATMYLRYDPGRGTNIGLLARRAAPPESTVAVDDKKHGGFTLERLRAEDGKLVLSTSVVPVASLGLRVSPFNLEHLEEGQAVSAGKVASVFLRSIIRESLTAKGLLDPVVKALQTELQGLGTQSVAAP